MEELPNIKEILLAVIEHFEPMAKSIHPEATKGFVFARTMSLTRDWLKIEMEKAQESYQKKTGLLDF